ncbi:MAG: hypothetical protein K9L68_13875 [Spirochaetales bacterium]|nr:hypothetical protein [Spirochaetales bacterium]
MANILSSIIDFGAREEMGMDIDDYKKKSQGGQVSGAGNLTTKRFNAELRKRQREDARANRPNPNNQTKSNSNNSNSSKTENSKVDISNLSTKDIMDKNKVSEDEIKKIYDKLYQEGELDPNLDYKSDYYDQRLIVRDFLKNKGS